MVKRTRVELINEHETVKTKQQSNILMFVENPPRARFDATMRITQDNMVRKLGKRAGHLWLNALQDVFDTGVGECHVMCVHYENGKFGSANVLNPLVGKDWIDDVSLVDDKNRYYDVAIYAQDKLIEFNRKNTIELQQGVANGMVSVRYNTDNAHRFDVYFPSNQNGLMFAVIKKSGDDREPDITLTNLERNHVFLSQLPAKLVYDNGAMTLSPADTINQIETYDIIIHDGNNGSREYLNLTREQLEQVLAHGNIRVIANDDGIMIYFD